MDSKDTEKPPGRPVAVHPVWYQFMEYCKKLKHGELGKVSIQDGLPVSAEFVKEKIKFTKPQS